MENRIKLGVSKCLLGEMVRYDGGHKLDRFIRDTLGQYVDFVPVCPEVECGMPVPREAMRLVGDPESPRLVTIRSGKDMTQQMLEWAAVRVRELESEDLCGYIFKSNSPSSGMERVKVYNEKGMPLKKGVGLFAKAFMDHFPLLPTEEEGRLHDPQLRENFIESIFALKRWRKTKAERLTTGSLVAFHTKNKLQLMSHSIVEYRAMGKLVAKGKELPVKDLYKKYQVLLLKALGLKCTVNKHTNVLQHMMGYFKKQLSPDEKQELLDVIFDYHNGLTPLIVPVTLFNHYVRKYDEAYLKQQTYLNPHPTALKLRNHA
ncbi:MAG: DUF523 and DUF1722 domain-containing protein [Deltaproteobacteria bacterium]|nr:DUF523 and DUF1722 domain-containing protein [Deltaproteobacteria bacterium]